MRAFEDYETTPEFTESVKLPAGAYEVTLKRAEEKYTEDKDTEDKGGALCILFDISSGEYKDYFMNKLNSDRKAYQERAKYNSDKREDEDKPKFKGVFRLWYPKETDKNPETTKRRMKTVLKLIKEENKLNVDFSKEWDGAVFKNAKMGMVFRDKEYNYKGYRGFTAEPYKFISLDDLKNGNYTIPEPKRLEAPTNTYSDNMSAPPLTDEDLPF